MNQRHIFGALLAATSLMSTGCAAAQPPRSAASLCKPMEKIIFSCPIGKKTVSVCGRDGRSVYRFGKLSRIELESRDPRFAERAYSGGGESQILVDNKGYRYTLYNSTIRTAFAADDGHDPKSDAGLIVHHAGKTISTVKCGGAREAFISSDAAKYMPAGDFTLH